MSTLIFPVTVCILLLVACGGGGNSGNRSTDVSIQPATSIRFTDTDPHSGEIGGTVTIGRAADETQIDEYRIYWSNETGSKLATLLSLEKPAGSDALVGLVPQDTPIPGDATHLLVVTRNARDEMSNGVSTVIEDSRPTSPLPAVKSIRFKDSDNNQNEIAGDVMVIPPDNEADIVGYSVYWVNGEGGVLSPPIASALKASEPVAELSISIPADTAVPGDARQLMVGAYNDDRQSTSGPTTALLDFATNAEGRGPGGNGKTGVYYYGDSNRPPLALQRRRVDDTWECVMDNGFVMAIDMDNQVDTRPFSPPDRPQTVDDSLFPAYRYPCGNNNENTHRAVNGAFSPLNDALYFGTATFNMFYEYLNDTPLQQKIRLRVHYGQNLAFASWDGAYANFGDGNSEGDVSVPRMYPLPVADVVAHEIAHGFTRRYSNLFGGQADAVNEAFSDMVGETVEHYLYGRADWQHNNALVNPNRALRYFSRPADDGNSIDSLKDYDVALSDHYNAGIFRKAFYLLAHLADQPSTTVPWTPPLALKAFALANKYCWQRNSTFNQAAQCVLDESPRLLYDLDPGCLDAGAQCRNIIRNIQNDIRKIFAQVDIDLNIGGTQALFEVNTGILELRLSDTSKVEDGNAIGSWLWDFGDGQQTTEQSPVHRYTAPGRYLVTLTITDYDNTTDVYSREVDIAADYCEISSSDSSQHWIAGVSIGNFTQYSGNTRAHYPSGSLGLSPGTQVPLRLLAGAAQPGADTRERYWRVWIDYNRDGEFTDELVLETAGVGDLETSISLPAGLPLGSSRLRIVMKTNNFPGRPCGNAGRGETEDYDLSFHPVEVDANADFDVDIKNGTIATGAEVFFTNNSRVLTGSTFQWDFGDGSTSAQPHPVHRYMAAGSYVTTLTVTTPGSGEIEVEKEIVIDLIDGYCAAGADDKTQFERIASVTFNAVTQDSGGEAGGYLDFTERVTLAMTPGAGVNYRLTPWFQEDAVAEFWRVWVDYDHNQVFDDDELVVQTRGAQPATGSFTVPGDAVAGTTRLRAMLTYRDSNDPCHDYGNDLDGGQVADYGVIIAD